MRRYYVPTIALALLLGPPGAHAQKDGAWQGDECGLSAGHFLVSSAAVHLKAVAETKFEDERQKRLGDALRTLTQAFETAGQGDNPTAWYYLGRYYLMKQDAAGADSALQRAVALAPRCADDVRGWRRYYWVPVVNAGIAAFNAGLGDSAIAVFRRANLLYRGEPQALLALAQLYAAGAADSAIKYFRLGIEAAGADTALADQRKQAMFNLARMYHRQQRWEDAAGAYRRYLEAYPNDAEATAALASVYGIAGQADSATAVYERLLARAETVSFMDLVQAGTHLYRTAAQGEGDGAREGYALAAQAFEAGLAKNPHYRDALFNLANTYYQLADTTRMLGVARRLIVVDPLNRTSLQLVAQAFQFAGRRDSALYYLNQASEVLAVDVTFTDLRLQPDEGVLGGVVTNLRQRRSPALSLVVEFLTAEGRVVATDTVAVPAIAPEDTHEIRARGQARGIAAYRYRRARS